MLSHSALKINVRRYTTVTQAEPALSPSSAAVSPAEMHSLIFGVRWCRLTL